MADDDTVNLSLAGSWLGQYFYPGGRPGSTFEAVFVQVASAIEGNILDAGGLGEARAVGRYIFPRVSFVKTYVRPGYKSIDYRGSISAKGDIVLGYWYIYRDPDQAPLHGVWVMHRNGSEEQFDLQKLATEYPLDEEMRKDREEQEANSQTQ